MIEARSLSKVYQRGRHRIEAVRNVSLHVDRGEFLVIEGISGSGKTTLLQLLGGMDRPTGGTVVLDGQDLSSLNENQLTLLRREKLGFVFQSFNLIGTLNARDNVEAALVGERMRSSMRSEQALAALGRVGMAERWHHRPARLSGGEQQRVAIARALVRNPSIVLADEPTGDLDTKTGLEVIGMLKALSEKSGATVVVVTHAPYVTEFATQRATMLDGSLTLA